MGTLRPRKAPKRVLSVVETGFIAALVIALVSRMTILAHDSDKLAHLNGTSPVSHVYPEANHSLPADVDDDLTVAHHHHHHTHNDDVADDDAIDDDAPAPKKKEKKHVEDDESD